MKTILIVKQEGQSTKYPETHIFNGSMEDTCQQAFDKGLFDWAESPRDIEEAILNEEGLVCYTTDKLVVHSLPSPQ